ncbi:MAG: hypothetical protein A2X49_13340 [Lentisphaerae bacterium GWF2_52_8]|nr:MAG: hypothetical protein A2X49_13340 [Lentisphaerae bacterium GWF2_52_8]
MSEITTKDGTTIYYKDWGLGTGPPLAFSHAWPLVCRRLGQASKFTTATGKRFITSRSPDLQERQQARICSPSTDKKYAGRQFPSMTISASMQSK